jgi:hypothetical protein
MSEDRVLASTAAGRLEITPIGALLTQVINLPYFIRPILG